MKQHKLLQRVLEAILFSALFVGCSALFPRTTSTQPPVDPTETVELTLPPTGSSTPIPSVTPRPTVTATPLPGWVTDFAEPILAAIADLPPDVQEDFSQVGPNWNLETVNCPDNGCSISEGVLTVAAFPGNNKGGWAEQPLGPCCARFKTFLMQVDVDPSKLTDENTASIWYTANIYEGNKFTTKFQLTFELKKDLRWSNWIGPSGFGGDSGQLPHSTALPIIFTLISRNSMLAIYLNDIPVTFVEYAGGQYQPGFELCAWTAERTAAHAEFDNVKVWNLDNIPDLP